MSAAIAVESDVEPVSVSRRKITAPPKAAVTFCRTIQHIRRAC